LMWGFIKMLFNPSPFSGCRRLPPPLLSPFPDLFGAASIWF